jgi:hypothetical protein
VSADGRTGEGGGVHRGADHRAFRPPVGLASSTVSDAAARSSLYVFALSSFLVSLGFIAQSPDLVGPFMAVVMPGLFLLGIFTIVRLVDTALENNQYLAGIARIRAYYRTLTPDAAEYFSAETGRWPETTTSPSLGLGVAVAFLGTTATMIAFINSVVAGAGIALVVRVITGPGGVALGLVCGAASAVLLMSAFYLFQRWRFASTPLPSQPKGDPAGERQRRSGSGESTR